MDAITLSEDLLLCGEPCKSLSIISPLAETAVGPERASAGMKPWYVCSSKIAASWEGGKKRLL